MKRSVVGGCVVCTVCTVQYVHTVSSLMQRHGRPVEELESHEPVQAPCPSGRYGEDEPAPRGIGSCTRMRIRDERARSKKS